MEKEFVEKMKEALLAHRQVILDSIAAQNDDFQKIVETADTGDVIDVASDVIDGKLLESLGVQDSQRLQQINNALDRIKQDKYGYCLKCGREIPKERLEAVPYAFMCIDCKSQDERRNR